MPIRFIHTPPLTKPGKRANAAEILTYKKLCKTQNLSTRYIEEVRKLREHLDAIGCTKKQLMVTDGSFCNRICMNLNMPGVEALARARKNSKLCYRAEGNGRRTYGVNKFTPEQVRQDDSIPWQSAIFFYGGEWRRIRFKVLRDVLWQSGTKTRPMRLLVVAPLPYVKNGIRNYRQPAYLLTTDLEATAEFLLQSYLDRWQIEVNFREEKSVLGVGEAQVWSEKSAERQPSFRVAVYSALLLSSILKYKDVPPIDEEIPKWRDKPQRNTCRALIGMIRSETLENIESIIDLELTRPMLSAIFRKAA